MVATENHGATQQNPAVSGMGNNGVLAVYQVLAARVHANRNLVWQIPTLTLTIQALLVAVSAQANPQTWARFILAGTILLLGAVSLAQQHAANTDWTLDLHMLDKYEQLILGDEYRDYRLRIGHSDRDEKILAQLGSSRAEYMSSFSWHWRLIFKILRFLSYSIFWGVLQVIVSVLGAIVPLLPLLVG